MKKRYFFLVFLCALLSIPASHQAQCYQSVTFYDWEPTGDSSGSGAPFYCPTAGDWSIQSNGTQVRSECNTNFPKMYVGPDTLINVKITGTFKVEDTSDDDYVGFVFGFHETWDYAWSTGQNTMNHEYYLFDWKKNGQTYSGYTALEGFSLDKVDGTFTRNNAGTFPSFWVHTNSTNFQVLQTQYSTSNGWVANTAYDFELYYTPTRAIITIDQDTIFDESGCFEPGLFGFYNYSQQYARYWNFNYELFIDFGMESEDVCLGDSMQFVFTDTGACYGANTFTNLDTFYWDLGDGTVTNDTNPLHLYDSSGVYHVQLIATDINGCTDTASKYVFIHLDPEAAIGFDNVCLDDPMQFTDLTTVNYGNAATWQWDFGDGSSVSNQTNPSHTYSQAGTYTTRLIVLDNAGCIDTAEIEVEVYPNPEADFTVDDVCDGLAVQMEDSSTQALIGIASYKWDVQNDGSTDYTDTNASHTYSTHGSYDIKLKITDSLGCRDSATQTVVVFPAPTADFIVSKECFNVANEFYDNSAVATGPISSWFWDFGDGTTSTLQNPTHTYTSPGQKIAKLVVTTNGGCQDSIIKPVTVYALPVALFQPTPVCENLAAVFVQNSTSESGILSQFYWDFGDGVGNSYVSGPVYDYSQPGLYSVTLSVETQFGCEDTAVRNMRVYPAPVAAFSWKNNICEGTELPIYDLSTIVQVTPGGDQITNWHWNINDQISTLQNPIFLTTVAVQTHASLIVTTNYGCMDSTEANPEVFPLPSAEFEYEIACQLIESHFKSTSDVKDGLVNQWNWDFGDGSTSADENPSHSFDLPGNYEVRFYVKSNKNCPDTISKQIYIPETPRVDFEASPIIGCSPLKVTLTNLSQLSVGNLSYRWSLDNVFFSTEFEPSLEVTNDTVIAREFEIALVATSDEGCVAQKIKQDMIKVNPAPIANFDFDSRDFNMFNPKVEFRNKSLRGVRWLWEFGDGNQSKLFAPFNEFEQSGEYEVKLTAWNVFDCTDTIVKQVTIDPITTLYIPTSFTPNHDGKNDVWKFEGFAEGSRIEISIWDRWGLLIIKSNSFDFSWDGRLSSGEFAQNGVYVFEIVFETSTGEVEQINGQITMMR